MNNKEYDYYENKNESKSLFDLIKRKGIVFAFKKGLGYLGDIILSRFLFLKQKRYFLFNNVKLPYFYHKYNKTWKNERAVEIPIFLNLMKRSNGKEVLEIGHVIGHYAKIKHDVLDKYEKEKGVINEDALTFKPNKKYDLIISVSTFEHIGVDDVPKAPEKTVRAISNIKNNCLSREGNMYLSFPVNYNSALMKMINAKKIKNYDIFCFKKADAAKNLWMECSYSEIRNLPHSQPVKGLVILKINKGTKIKL